MTPEEFEQRMIQIGLTAQKNAVKTVRKAYMAVATSVATETPCDVGTAVSNWLPSIDAPVIATREAYAPGSQGSTRDANVEGAIAAAEAVAAAYQGGGEALYIANSLHYIQYLNAGSSKQSPGLFAETAVARGAVTVKGVRLLEE